MENFYTLSNEDKKNLFLSTLNSWTGTMRELAVKLGMSYRAFCYHAKRYGLSIPRERPAVTDFTKEEIEALVCEWWRRHKDAWIGTSILAEMAQKTGLGVRRNLDGSISLRSLGRFLSARRKAAVSGLFVVGPRILNGRSFYRLGGIPTYESSSPSSFKV